MDESKRRLVASLAIVDHDSAGYWLVDASPDVGKQIQLLISTHPGYHLEGILLTHAHIGHYLGLAFLGREALNTQQLPVLCTERMANFLCKNQPWKQLVDLGNIELSIVDPGYPICLSPAATATPNLVPHRDELSDTVAWNIAGPTKQLIYCPDIDRWERGILEAIAGADIALLDGTFYSADELPGRDVLEIPHPSIVDSMNVFQGFDTNIRFIHLNHTNPLLSDEEQVTQLKASGFDLGKRGDIWKL